MTFKSSMLFLIWRCPWVVSCSQTKPTTLKVFKAWLAGSCWNVICIPYIPPRAPMNWNSETLPCESNSEDQLFVSSFTQTKSYSNTHKITNFPYWFKEASFVGTNIFLLDFIYHILFILLEIKSFGFPSVTQDLVQNLSYKVMNPE